MFRFTATPAAHTDRAASRGGAGRSPGGHRRAGAGPLLLLYGLIAAALLWPYRFAAFHGGGDAPGVIGMMVEARNGLGEGQFPLRVAPTQLGGGRLPWFQFYGNFPFTLAGLLQVAGGADAYAAYRSIAWAALVAGGFFANRAARVLTRSPAAGVLGGAVFMTAPYLLTDLNARGAYTEFVAVSLLPACLYATARAAASRRWRYPLASAVAWAAVGMTHNITYLYGVLFVGLFAVARLATVRPAARRGAWARRQAARAGRLAVAGAAHAALVAWYVAPQLAVLDRVRMGAAGAASPFDADVRLAPLRVLLWPTLRTAEASTTVGLGLQIGWPALAGAALLAAAVVARPQARRRYGRTAAVVLGLFVCAAALAWSPVDVWRYLPRVLYFVQFPYRLLMFTALFGSLAVAVAAAAWGARGPLPVAAALAGIGLAVYSHVPRPQPDAYSAHLVRLQTARPWISGVTDYQLAPEHVSAPGSYRPGMNFAGVEFGIVSPYGVGLLWLDPWTLVPTPQSAAGLRVAGEVVRRTPVVDLTVTLGPTVVMRRLAAGRFDFVVPTPHPLDRRPTLLGVTAVGPGKREADVTLSDVSFVDPVDDAAGAYVPASGVRSATGARGVVTVTVDLPRPARVQVPVLYYPGLLDVRVNGRPAAHGYAGRFVAVDLPAGRHVVSAAFVGLRWATAVSGVAWAGVLAALLVAAARAAAAAAARARRGQGRSPRPRAPAVARGAAWACAAFAAVLSGGLVASGILYAEELLDPIARPTRITGGGRIDRGHLAAMAFDRRPATSWTSDKPEGDRITIKLPRRTPLTAVELTPGRTDADVWRRMEIQFRSRNRTVHRQSFTVDAPPDGAPARVAFAAVTADELRITFSDPVAGPRPGPVPPVEELRPGYAEIVLRKR